MYFANTVGGIMKKICYLLILSTLLGTLFVSGCGKGTDDETGDVNVSSFESEAPQTEYLSTLDVPAFDVNEEFVIYQFGTATIAAGQTFEKECGERICDSLYYRNTEMKNQYGVNIVYKGACHSNVSIVETTTDYIRTENMAQAENIDLWEFSVVNAAPLMYGGSNFLDLRQLPNVNLDNPWWASDANKYFEINGKMFTGTGDVSLSYYGMPFCLSVNKQLAEECGINKKYGKDVYTLVRDGEWTYDKMIAMSKDAVKDLNGDLKIAPEDDRYGFQYDMGCGYAFLTSWGLHFSEVENGLPVVKMADDTTATAAEWIRQNLGADSTHSIGGYNKDTEVIQIFSGGRSLFGSAQISHIVSKMRNYTFDFGVLPMPKKDEEQQEHYSYANIYYSAFIGVPYYTEDEAKTGFMLEAMAYKSYNSVREKYIDECVISRANHEDDADMLRIVLDSVYYDLNLVMNFGKTRDYYLKYIHGEIPNYVSTMKGVESKCEEEIRAYVESFS